MVEEEVRFLSTAQKKKKTKFNYYFCLFDVFILKKTIIMNREELITIFNESETIAEICRKLYGKKNGGMHNRVLKLFEELDYDWNAHVLEISNKKKKYCLNCGKEITSKHATKFCCLSCAAQYNNKIKEAPSVSTKLSISEGLKKYYETHKLTDEEKWKNYCKKYKNVTFDEYLSISTNRKKYSKLKINLNDERYCLTCGKKLDGYKTLFCSNGCKKAFDEKQYNEYIERWKKGEESGCTESYKIHRYVKRYLMEKNNNSCEECGWGEKNKFTNTVPLQIHHIDGDCTNNCEENLQLLCPNCHALTENFGSRNKNSKRIFRKQKNFKQEIIK